MVIIQLSAGTIQKWSAKLWMYDD